MSAEKTRDTTDEALLERFRRGDPRAFEELMRRHRNALYNFIHRSVRQPQTAEEIAAQAAQVRDANFRIEVKNPGATVEHEATTSKISEDQLFYCRQRGLTEEDASTMIVNGFCREVFDELPMEYAVEAQALMRVSLEGAVG